MSSSAAAPAAGSGSQQIIKLQTSDDETFAVDQKVAERSVLIKSMIEGECSSLLATQLLDPNAVRCIRRQRFGIMERGWIQ